MAQEDPKVKGGLARAEALTPEQRKSIARKAAQARWDADIPQTLYEGEFPIGTAVIKAAVLPNGKRLLTQASFMRAIGRSRSPKARTGVLSTVEGLPFFLQAESLRPFISEELMQSTTPIFYRDKSGNKAVGYDAEILPQVAEVYLKFKDDCESRKVNVPQSQIHIVKACEILTRGLARVGIVALVDEATGYQADRAKDALSKILEEFISKELSKWVKTFPDDYYQQLFRLMKMTYDQFSTKRSPIIGKLTNDIVYQRLAPGVLSELQRLTPRDNKGRAKHKYHQRLTPDMGHPKLKEHLSAVIALMKVSSTYKKFRAMLDQALPKYSDQLTIPGYNDIPIDVDDDDDEN